MPCVVDGSRISTFAYTRSYRCIRQLFHITYHVKVIDSRSRMFGSQGTKIQTLPGPTFLKLYVCNKTIIDSDTLFTFFSYFL